MKGLARFCRREPIIRGLLPDLELRLHPLSAASKGADNQAAILLCSKASARAWNFRTCARRRKKEDESESLTTKSSFSDLEGASDCGAVCTAVSRDEFVPPRARLTPFVPHRGGSGFEFEGGNQEHNYFVEWTRLIADRAGVVGGGHLSLPLTEATIV